MKIRPVPVRDDNYAYLIIDEATKQAAAVDPYDVGKVSAAAEDEGVDIIAALTTHHHHDHSGGNPAFAKKYPDAPIYGGSEKVQAVTQIVKDKDEFTLSKNINVKCLATPCHTQDSICYHVTDKSKDQPGGVFTGDTLFLAGCGRFFEGTGAQMHAALSYLSTLPSSTIVYNGHEYTQSSLKFGRSVEPGNRDMERLQKVIDDAERIAREGGGEGNGVTTGKTTIGDEKTWNVFMRLREGEVLKATGASADTPEADIITTLREQKNSFRG